MAAVAQAASKKAAEASLKMDPEAAKPSAPAATVLVTKAAKTEEVLVGGFKGGARQRQEERRLRAQGNERGRLQGPALPSSRRAWRAE